jgi:DNA polymerase-3 subunit delta'
MRAAFVQGSSKARGQFTDVLDALTVLLHERSRDAAQAGDGAAAASAARAVRYVEEAKRAAEGNAIPQLVSARLLEQLAEVGA